MNATTPRNSTQRILLDLVENDRSKLYPMLRRFAAAGDLEVLRQALDAGVPQSLSSTGSSIFAVVAPLRAAAVERRTAEDMITQWYIACGSPKQEQMDWALSTAKDKASAADLLAMGANPNGWIDTGTGPNKTVLSIVMERSIPALEVMLEHLAQRDELPLYEITDRTPDGTPAKKNLFDLLAAAATNRGNWNDEIITMEFLEARGIPRSWALEMGQALLRALDEAPINTAGAGLMVAPHVLTLSAFDDTEQWYKMLRKCETLIHELFQQSDTHPRFSSTIKHAIADGAHIDQIPSFVRGIATSTGVTELVMYAPVTLLQSAVLYGAPELVKTFIDLGASLDVALPDMKRTPGDLSGATLMEVAEKRGHTEISQILSSALAKRRVEQVVAQARQSRAEPA